jgi:hypothetical protein
LIFFILMMIRGTYILVQLHIEYIFKSAEYIYIAFNLQNTIITRLYL